MDERLDRDDMETKRKAVLSLTSEGEPSVLALAVHLGQTSLIKVILNVPEVYRFDRGEYAIYDVTSFTPAYQARRTKQCSLSCCQSNRVDVDESSSHDKKILFNTLKLLLKQRLAAERKKTLSQRW